MADAWDKQVLSDEAQDWLQDDADDLRRFNAALGERVRQQVEVEPAREYPLQRTVAELDPEHLTPEFRHWKARQEAREAYERQLAINQEIIGQETWERLQYEREVSVEARRERRRSRRDRHAETQEQRHGQRHRR